MVYAATANDLETYTCEAGVPFEIMGLDICLIATAGVEPLAAFVGKVFLDRPLDHSVFDLKASVDRSTSDPYPYLQDLCTLTRRILGNDPAARCRFEEPFVEPRFQVGDANTEADSQGAIVQVSAALADPGCQVLGL